MLLFVIHTISSALNRTLPHYSCVTRILICYLVHFAASLIILLLLQLFNIIIPLFLYLMLFLSFQEIIRIQNKFKIQFYIPLESHFIANLEPLRTKQMGFHVNRWLHRRVSTYYIAAELNTNRLASLYQLFCSNFTKNYIHFCSRSLRDKKYLNDVRYIYTLLGFIKLIKLRIESKI